MNKKSYVFTTLAMNQTLFFQKIAENLLLQGHQVSFICFHERSHEYLVSKKLTSYNPYTLIQEEVPESANVVFSELIHKYKMPESNYILSHEVESFGLTFSNVKVRFVQYIKSLEAIFTEIEQKSQGFETLLVQELGGFASIISSYYVGNFFGFKNFFLEPSFFKGRVFVIPSSFQAFKIILPSSKVSDSVTQYLLKAAETKQIVIPDKDKAHYYSLTKKIFRLYNFRRFCEKVTDKYILNKQEEFSFIENYTKRHLMMFVNKFFLKKYYQKIPTQKFIYYPLHVPMDVALTVRSPHCLDQISVIDLICRSAPENYKVVFKEHPAMVGVMSADRIAELLKKNDNLMVLDPGINNYEVLGRADLIVTVNSKAGAEALMLGKKVVVMGDSFYSESKLVYKQTDFSSLSTTIQQALSGPAPDPSEVKNYFQAVWEASYPGEIYSPAADQIEKFTTICGQL